MSILNEIAAYKTQQVEERKSLYPIKLLERSIYFQSPTLSLSKYILRNDLSGIIAEFKRKSPTRGIINEFAKPEKVCLEYMRAGASALSVLTDEQYFGGSSHDLTTARRYNFCPILRKDFVVDEYQVIEARSIGADAILLIAEMLTEAQLKSLALSAMSLGLEILFEIHDSKSIDKLPHNARIIGVNSRDLNNFSVNINHITSLLHLLSRDVVKVAESGIDSPETLINLKKRGFNGFLIGERFMRNADPGKACELFIRKIAALEQAESKSREHIVPEINQ
ncbi:MAG: indole-3-glycerol phosphate synthase TrpC [Bacteroidales bacterium]|jgi:indole-3-glycerol phosphate synthase|nr:indole-3-glycerol phosphate synthase TrpC [Bacteroidales bacterium]MDD2264814.1 indole-3-glycerol phosphate synthase TrpC [Bacteroidales bacterium]MDD2832088.1 indole-3-glycerol phosphate synthase TrpC [Bacteroidales bacterium]MDD3208718.1 indole-3-glycerol phosphate synthase TrpC [Bacteroidales bacterium]MDD3697281.1 indole-3-glycerol phosphate synthase TrpC [Bacteroidales bacterium]